MVVRIIRRRSVLQLGGGLAFAAAGAGAAFAAASGERKFVFVILRGALDGLAAAPPYGDARYAALRGPLAIAAPGTAGGAFALSDGLGLHPRLEFLAESWGRRELGLLHAASSAYRDRSHFDGQDVLESGGAAVYAMSDGWLNRALAATPPRNGVAVSSALPLVLRGRAPASNYAPSFAPPPSADTLTRLMDLYAGDPLLGPALAAAAETEAIAGGADMAGAARSARGGYAGQWKELATAAARLLSQPQGPAAGVLAFDGWDTHANQGAAEGALAVRLGALDAALRALRDGLGDAWTRTVVVVATEFGRTVAVNGTGGTDHGTGGAAFVVGGAVKGGRILGDWPGLGALHQNRDLPPANDLRALFAGVLGEHWGLSRADLAARVFPGAGAIARLEGIVRA